MAVVDVRTVELDDAAQFLHDSSTSCFNAQDIEDFNATVRIRPPEINAVDAHHGLEVDSIRLQNPLFLLPRLNAALIANSHLVVFQQKHTLDVFDAAQTDGVEHSVL